MPGLFFIWASQRRQIKIDFLRMLTRMQLDPAKLGLITAIFDSGPGADGAVGRFFREPSKRSYAGTWLAGLERILPTYRKRCRN